MSQVKQVASIFNFQNNIVRTIVINGEIWFVGIDVAKALGYANAAKTVTQHCRKYKPLISLDCPNWACHTNQDVMGLDHKTNMIQEPDLGSAPINRTTLQNMHIKQSVV